MLLPTVRSLQMTISGSDPERSVDLAQAEVALLGQLPARSSLKTHVNVPRIRELYPRPASGPGIGCIGSPAARPWSAEGRLMRPAVNAAPASARPGPAPPGPLGGVSGRESASGRGWGTGPGGIGPSRA